MYDTLIIGGGFFGLYISEYFAKMGQAVLLVEQEQDLMKHASYHNQARVHRGYHYPRSVLTAIRSCQSFARFVAEFPEAIDRSFTKIYMIGRILGKVTAHQFEQFCKRIGAPLDSAPKSIMDLVNPRLIERGWITEEYAFNADALRKTMLERVNDAGVEVRLQTRVARIRQHRGHIVATLKQGDQENLVPVRQVFNCTYSFINRVNRSSDITPIPLKHEMTEMCLVDVPPLLRNAGITVMCGPFFSVMPFPARGKHSFSHVRYTPHYEWQDSERGENHDRDANRDVSSLKSNWNKMRLDATRYIPFLDECKYVESLYEVKTVLPRSEVDDSRPILMRFNHGIDGFHCVLGGKIDNVYDAIEAISKNRQASGKRMLKRA